MCSGKLGCVDIFLLADIANVIYKAPAAKPEHALNDRMIRIYGPIYSSAITNMVKINP